MIAEDENMMTRRRIPSAMGEISVAIDRPRTDGTIPVVFLHGVFMDASLWSGFGTDLTGCTHVFIDMPGHGQSGNVGRDWTLDDCAELLLHLLEELSIPKAMVIGHSWGAMTALRAAIRDPARFSSLGLFNMPFRVTTGIRRVGFALQKWATIFPRFYARQAAKALYTPDFLLAHPELVRRMEDRLAQRPPREIARVIDAVLLDARDASQLMRSLKVPALAVIGSSDYVGSPPGVETIEVPGGHVSPQEAPDEIRHAIQRVITMAVPVGSPDSTSSSQHNRGTTTEAANP